MRSDKMLIQGGRMYAIYKAIGVTVICVIGIIISIILMSHKQVLIGQTTGRISNLPDCIEYINKSDRDNPLIQYRCTNMIITYTVDSKEHEIVLSTDSTRKYEQNNMLNIFYDPSNPKKAQLSSDATKSGGIILFIISLLILAFAWFMVWWTQHSEGAAEAEGIYGIATILEGR